MWVKVIQILCLWGGFAVSGAAQDLHFSQQYATRLHLNPAYAGLHADYSATLSYRQQWPLGGNAFTTNQFAGYYRLANEKTAVGLLLATDKAGSNGLVTFQLGGLYAYQSIINENLAFSAGMSFTYHSRRIDFSELTFGDQLNEDGTSNPVSRELNVYNPVNFLSIGTGGTVYNNNFWLSLAASHLNQPDMGFAAPSRLAAKVQLNGGYKFRFQQYYYRNKPYEWSVSPSVTYTHQGKFKKTDLGLYTSYTPVTLGILYRGLPVISNYGYDQALVLITGIIFDPVKIGYSYDVPLSPYGNRSGGAHEISLSFERIDYNKIFKKRVSGKNYKRIPCPSF
jgi:type IX secretion system PorP/SprF family membrane protein